MCTHAHDDHVNQAPALSDRFDAPVYLHPAEAPLWAMAHPDRKPDHDLCDGDVLTAGGIELQVITTPGHSPGSSCLYVPELGTVFTGDTLFQGGPGATGRSFSSFDTIIDSIRTRLLTLPGDTTVRTGHGDSTSIGAEAAAPGGVDRAGALTTAHRCDLAYGEGVGSAYPDADFPADPYPGAVPPFSFVHLDEHSHPLTFDGVLARRRGRCGRA